MSFVVDRICPYCQRKIENLDYACLCSKCGTPHHRDCWNKGGGCGTFGCDSVNAEDANRTVKSSNSYSQNISLNSYEPVKSSFSGSTTSNQQVYCSKCGLSNDSTAGYCSRCGNSLHGNYNGTNYNSQGYGQNNYSNQQNSQYIYSYSSRSTYSYPQRATYAGFWKRLVAVLIDGIILACVGGIIGLTAGITDMALRESSYLKYIGAIGGWMYYACFESSSLQATPGKLALGVIVTNSRGNKIGFGRATVRYFAKYISSLILMIGYLMAAFTEEKQALHDMIGGCLVVNKR